MKPFYSTGDGEYYRMPYLAHALQLLTEKGYTAAGSTSTCSIRGRNAVSSARTTEYPSRTHTEWSRQVPLGDTIVDTFPVHTDMIAFEPVK